MAELALYDSNRDGKIDAFDEVFNNFKVWQDMTGTGGYWLLYGRDDIGEAMRG